MDDGASLDELKRRAYSSDGAVAIEARERLAVLEREQEEQLAQEQDAPPPAVVELPRSRLVPRWAVTTLGLLAIAAFALATATVAVPTSSLEVFSRAPIAQDLTIPEGIGASKGTERWLGDYGGYGVFAFYTHTGEICLVAVEPDTVAGNCASREEFITSGIELNTGLFTSTGTEYFTVQWGPNGPPRFVDWMRSSEQP